MIYSEEEKKKDPQKEYTGLFSSEEKKCILYDNAAGRRVFYVGTLHEGLPVIKKINK